jgi:class 3 adenylate cyclase
MANKANKVAEAAGADRARVWSGVFVGAALIALEDLDQGLARIDAAHSEAVERGLIDVAANALYNGCVFRLRMFRPREALERTQLFETLRLGGRPSLFELAVKSQTWYYLGYPGRAREHAEQALVLARESQAHTFENWIRRDLGWAIAALGDPVEGLKVMGPVDMTVEVQDLVLQLRGAMRLMLDTGDVAGATAHAMTIHARSDWGMLFESRALGDGAVEALIRADRVDEAEEVIARTRVERRLGHHYQDRMEGGLAFARGDLARAIELLTRAASDFEAVGHVEEMRTRRTLADVYLKAGDVSTAESELRKVVATADERGMVWEGDQARQKLAELGIVLDRPHADQQPSERAEERVVTVLFADVRGYTSMVASEAPADLVDKLASFHRWAKQEVERHYGVVDKFAGDAVMATFNASGTRLDHTLQALQAALAIRDKAAAAGLPIGIGIAVGAAVVGSLTPEANMSAIGEVTNLASRLQGQAMAGEIVLSGEAHKRTRDWLAEHLIGSSEEALSLKGFREPMAAHRLSDRAY